MDYVSSLSALQIFPDSRVLVFMPHPDDEAVFVSGLLKKLTSNKIVLKVITATIGEKSTNRFGLSPSDHIAIVRRRELLKSFKILGIDDFEILSFPDGGLSTCQSELKKMVDQQLADFNPTHVLTLEPNGIYGHPDHKNLTQVVSKIIKPPIKLLFSTVLSYDSLPETGLKPLSPSFCLKLNLSERSAKKSALRAHMSQLKVSELGLKHFNFFHKNKMLGYEYYVYKK